MEELTDAEIWALDATALYSMKYLKRKLELTTEVIDYVLPGIRRIQRRIMRTSAHIDKYLDAIETRRADDLPPSLDKPARSVVE